MEKRCLFGRGELGVDGVLVKAADLVATVGSAELVPRSYEGAGGDKPDVGIDDGVDGARL